jgi:hypothetical protein
MKSVIFSITALAAAACGTASAEVGEVPRGVPHLDHVWVIMMENHGYSQIVNNPNAPYINQLAKSANVATNYFAVAHPSLTNYLEVNGGSNFGVLDDNNPDWHNATCQPNIASGAFNFESVSTRICPIAGPGTDAATPAIDYYNETTGTPGMPSTGDWNLDGKKSFDAAQTDGMTIADQLEAAHSSWKSYQESLPLAGADGVDNSDGFFVNTSDLTVLSNPAPTGSQVVALYAAKHNPFVYFKSVQEGGLGNVRGFDGDNGLFADLATGDVPAYSFIAPNQCNDQHGKGGAGVYCAGDPNDNGTQTGLNPGLIYRGDVTVQRLVAAIQQSSVWPSGNNAIVVVWDENDYSVGIPNQVLTMVVRNGDGPRVVSDRFYTHFSLLKTLEGGFGLPCLNNACNPHVKVMSDLFGGGVDH